MADRKPIVNSSGTLGELVSTDSLLVPSVTFEDGSNISSSASIGSPLLNFSASGIFSGFIQNAFWHKRVSMHAPNGGNYGIATIGAPPLTTQGTLTHRWPAASNMFKRTKRQGYVSSATAGSVSGFRVNNEPFWLGDGSIGGLFSTVTFGCSDAATVAGARQFVGMYALSYVPPANVEPSTLLNCIGVGHGEADTNLQVYISGSTAQPPIDLGADFPINTLSVDVYRFSVQSKKSPSGELFWKVERLNTGHVAEGSVVGVHPVMPLSTTPLSNLWAYRSNNATALAVGLDFMFSYTQTDA